MGKIQQEDSTAERSQSVRERIVEGTHQVIAEKGSPAVTFRSVAQASRVALGSVSYHFADRNELIAAAIQSSRSRFSDRCEEAWQAVRNGRDLAETLANLVEELTMRKHDELVVDYELFLFGFHHPKLKSLSVEWSHDMMRDMIRCTTQEKGTLLALTLEGILLHSAKLGKMYFTDDVLPLFRIILGKPARAETA